ncbi:Gcv operon activator [Serratia rubidaea]|uniref:Gcv operon activator n=1 Tax=Serratia rubidaea TaxID=61652 RepID=A0A4U9HGE5_SERRU|nr:Gcv operon activator [Serratia rubidaea]
MPPDGFWSGRTPLPISVTPTFAAKLLIPRLAELNAALPGVELRTVATEALCDFERDQVDIAIRLTCPPFPSGLEARLLFHQELVAVASPHLVKELPLPLSPETDWGVSAVA